MSKNDRPSFRLFRAGLGAALLAGAAAAAITTDAAADGAKVTLTVTVGPFRNTKGNAIFALYSSKDAWLKKDKAVALSTQKVSGGSMTFKFENVAAGTYGVSVIHDENENGKLDMKILPPGPAEGAAVSNDATALIGPPSWSDAKFTVGDKAITIKPTMRY